MNDTIPARASDGGPHDSSVMDADEMAWQAHEAIMTAIRGSHSQRADALRNAADWALTAAAVADMETAALRSGGGQC